MSVGTYIRIAHKPSTSAPAIPVAILLPFSIPKTPFELVVAEAALLLPLALALLLLPLAVFVLEPVADPVADDAAEDEETATGRALTRLQEAAALVEVLSAENGR